MIGDDENRGVFSDARRLKRIDYLAHVNISQRQRGITCRRFGTIAMVNPIRIQQMQQEQMRPAFANHMTGRPGPDFIAAGAGHRPEARIGLVRKYVMEHQFLA